MFYNVYIENSNNKRDYIIALNEDQINLIVDAYVNRRPSIRIKGVERDIANPIKLIIYDIRGQELGTKQEDVEHNVHKMRHLSNTNKINLSVFRTVGSNITDQFLIGRERGPRAKHPNDQNKVETKPRKLFISHSSKDQALINNFINHILILGLGINRDEIFCTSVHGTNIKSGSDFKKAIFDNLKDASVVIQILTRNYKASEVCLNEMGAAWVLAKVVIPLVADPFDYDIGFIHSNNQQLKLNKEEDLIKFYDDHKDVLFTNNVNTMNLINQVRLFLNFIKSKELQEQQ